MKEKEYIKSRRWNLELVCSAKSLQRAIALVYSAKPVEMVFVRADIIDESLGGNKYFVYANYK